MQAAQADSSLLDKIEGVCLGNDQADFDADFYAFWRQWVASQRARS
jgi:hypothetical protein